jgi:SAM-dependent methyltransferase
MSSSSTPESDFPFVRKYLRDDTLCSRFNNMRHFHPRVLTVTKQPIIDNMPDLPVDLAAVDGKGKFSVLVEPMSTQKAFTELVDIFQEEQVIQAKWSDQPSMAETFEKHRQELDGLEVEEQRSRLRELTKPISRFRPTTLVCLIKMFKPKCILDFCSGFGDRLLGALAYSDRLKIYCGVDPNAALFPGYKRMIEFFAAKEDRSKFQMIRGCAESVELPDAPVKDGKYDMIVTSPPYRDLEDYTSSQQASDTRTPQSASKYTTLEEWYQHFLLPSIHRALRKLCKGGYLILSINDKPNGEDRYVERMVRDLNKVVTLQYEQVLHVATDLSLEHSKKDGAAIQGCQPIWVWRKTCDVSM